MHKVKMLILNEQGDVIGIRDSLSDVAREYGVTPTTIRRYVMKNMALNGRTFAYDCADFEMRKRKFFAAEKNEKVEETKKIYKPKQFKLDEFSHQALEQHMTYGQLQTLETLKGHKISKIPVGYTKIGERKVAK